MEPQESRTESDWPPRMRDSQAVQYLRERHGIKLATKTLRNRRAAGTGPKAVYFGSIPLTPRAEIDRWVEAVLSAEPSNHRRTGRQDQRAA